MSTEVLPPLPTAVSWLVDFFPVPLSSPSFSSRARCLLDNFCLLGSVLFSMVITLLVRDDVVYWYLIQ
jgi:hypothetical protein